MTDSEDVENPLPLRRIVYCSSGTAPSDKSDLTDILIQSRHNNAIDGVTGILWSDGARFVQVFEGPLASVASTWDRIRADPRHRNVNVIDDLRVGKREFGYWTMVHKQREDVTDHHDWQMLRLLRGIPATVAAPFISMMGLPRDGATV